MSSGDSGISLSNFTGDAGRKGRRRGTGPRTCERTASELKEAFGFSRPRAPLSGRIHLQSGALYRESRKRGKAEAGPGKRAGGRGPGRGGGERRRLRGLSVRRSLGSGPGSRLRRCGKGGVSGPQAVELRRARRRKGREEQSLPGLCLPPFPAPERFARRVSALSRFSESAGRRPSLRPRRDDGPTRPPPRRPLRERRRRESPE
jgi:hypothetical protein